MITSLVYVDDLIRKLQELRDQYGNLPVTIGRYLGHEFYELHQLMKTEMEVGSSDYDAPVLRKHAGHLVKERHDGYGTTYVCCPVIELYSYYDEPRDDD